MSLASMLNHVQHLDACARQRALRFGGVEEHQHSRVRAFACTHVLRAPTCVVRGLAHVFKCCTWLSMLTHGSGKHAQPCAALGHMCKTACIAFWWVSVLFGVLVPRACVHISNICCEHQNMLCACLHMCSSAAHG